MLEQDLLAKVIQILDAGKIEYMLTGSYVSSLQGQPRSTHDIDIIVAIKKTQVSRFAKSFPSPDFYLDEESIIEAIEKKDMFSLIETGGGNKIDFWLLTDSPFDQSRFSRRYIEEFMGQKIYVSSPEDTILAKLNWSKLSGGSQKQFLDALSVYEVQSGKLDIFYLEKSVKKLKLENFWQELKAKAQPLD